MGQYLCLNESIVQGKHVIELGAGTGYLSILCAKYLGASSVIASDGSDDVVNSLADGFFLNGLQGSSTIAPMDLKWGTALVGTEDSQWNGGRPVDLVLGADITYDVRIIPALVGTLTELSSLYPGVEIIICATQRNLNTPEVFVRQCASVGYQVKDVDFNPTPHDEQQGPFYNTSVPIRIIRCTSKPTKYSVGSGN
jgi:predicted nicotinamide N-methyase